MRALPRARDLRRRRHAELLGDEAHEREIQSGLGRHITRFLLELGAGFAFASDEVLLGLKARGRAPRTLALVGELLSCEPCGIAYRRDDPQPAQVVERAFRQVAESRELARISDQWFVRRLPGGERLDLRMGPQLTVIFEGLGLPP